MRRHVVWLILIFADRCTATGRGVGFRRVVFGLGMFLIAISTRASEQWVLKCRDFVWDGGSVVFTFHADDGAALRLLVRNREVRLGFGGDQVFLVSHSRDGEDFGLVEPGSLSEKHVSQVVKSALAHVSDPKEGYDLHKVLRLLETRSLPWPEWEPSSDYLNENFKEELLRRIREINTGTTKSVGS